MRNCFLLLISSLPLLAACSKVETDAVRDDDRPRITLAGTLEDEAIVEASGIARSNRRDGLMWVINDGGSKPHIHAIDHTGADRGRLNLDNGRNNDWEDLASFKLEGTPYLLVADIGDNDARRDFVTLYIMVEPDLSEDDKVREAYAWRIDFRYPDGPRDAESVAVDAAAGKILVLSKRDRPPVLYELPLELPTNDVLTATRLGEIRSLPKPSREDVEFAPVTKNWYWQPTSFDIWPDGSKAVILTYRGVYVFDRVPGQAWLDALNTRPLYAVGLGNIPNAEAVGFGSEPETIFVTIENRRAPLIRIDTEGELPE